MNPNPTIPSQTITLDKPDWRIATDPGGHDGKWFDVAQIVGSAELSERWTVFELAEKMESEPSAGQLSALPKTLSVGGVATKPHEFTIESGRLDLGELLGWGEQGKSAYVYIPFHVREDGLNTIGIGADWWHKAWIDGEVISDTLATGNGGHPPTMKDHLSKVQLRKGEHLLVVKFINGSASAVLTVGGPSHLRRVATGGLAGGVTGIYDPSGRVRFETRPIREWEFMATGTGVTGVTVNFPEEMVLQVNHSAAIDEGGKCGRWAVCTASLTAIRLQRPPRSAWRRISASR